MKHACPPAQMAFMVHLRHTAEVVHCLGKQPDKELDLALPFASPSVHPMNQQKGRTVK